MIAALLQYFFIAMFCWTVCEGLQFFMTLTTGKNKKSSRLKYFFIIGWSKLKWQISVGGSVVCEYSRLSVLLVARTFRETLQRRGTIRLRQLYSQSSVQCCTCSYKITKIVRALWLAERSVCMRLCKHGCGVKMFCFSRANHASWMWKSFRQVYFIYPFLRRLKLGKSFQRTCVK